MSSYFDEASLVMIPSGYKDQKVYSVKPLDGSGDLTFSRASSATRVASNGLIEKVRTNYCRYSQDFASWTLQGSTTRTTGVTDPNGGTTAATISNVSTTGDFTSGIRLDSNPMPIGAGNNITASVYLKGSGTIGIALERSVSGTYFFQTTSVTLTSSWVRYTFSPAIAAAADGFQIYVANFTGSTATSFSIAFAQVELGDIATDYIATTSAAVSVGPVSGLPRLDYLGSTCGKLLLEPQRTNISGYIESGTGNYSNATVTNPTNPLSILGLRSFRVTSNYSSGDAPHIVNATEYQSGTTYTASVYMDLAATNATSVEIAMFGFGSPNGAAAATLNVSTKAVTVTATAGAWTGATGKATLISGSIYRLEVTATAAQTLGGSRVYCAASADNKYVEVAGIQVEAGAYATSFISKSTTSSVTRVADAASKTSATALIGQTEGTIFGEFANPAKASGGRYFSLSDGDVGNRIDVYAVSPTQLGIYAAKDYVEIINVQFAVPANVPFKYAIAYKSGQWTWYLNGVQIATSANANVPTLNAIQVTTAANGGSSSESAPLIQALLFKTRLTNAQLAELTTL